MQRARPIRYFYVGLILSLLLVSSAASEVFAQSGESMRAYTPIFDIQGSESASPLTGARTDTFGIVTGVTPTGFYLQDPLGDRRAGTSDGIFVYTYSEPTVSVSDCIVALDALVSEFYGKTELSRVGRIEESDLCEADFVPIVQLPDFRLGPDYNELFERYEGMLVQIDGLDAVVHGPTKRYDSGEVEIIALPTILQPVVEGGRILRESETSTSPGEPWIGEDLLALSNLAGANLPDVIVGDRIHSIDGQLLTAIVDYNFGKYQLQLLPGQELMAEPVGLQPESAMEGGTGQFTVCSYNLHGFGTGTEQHPQPDLYDQALQRHANVIANSLHGCTIVALQEIGGPEDATALADALGSVYSLRYSPVTVKGPGSQSDEYPLTNSYLLRIEHVRALGAATMQGCSDRDYDVAVLPTEPCPQGQFPLFNRPPLVLDVAVQGEWEGDYELRLINNHWKSKSGDEEVNEIRRMLQAKHVADLSDEWLAGGENRRVIVLGDLNDYRNSAPISLLEHGAQHPLVNAWIYLPEADRYSYIFNGASQVLDHLLMSPNMLADLAGYDVVHLNADFAKCETLDAGAPQCQSSDHDILVAHFRPAGAAFVAGDLAYPGIGVTVTQDDGSVVRHIVTDSRGQYVLWDLQPGPATIVYKAPEWVTVGPPQAALDLEAGFNYIDQPYLQHDSVARAAEAAIDLIDAATEKR